MRIIFNFKGLGNAAFQDDGGFMNARAHEITRIMRNAADRLEGEDLTRGNEFVLFDINGNNVGYCVVEGDT